MRWRREKTVRVELVNPEVRLKAEQLSESKPEAHQAEQQALAEIASKEFVLKLTAFLSVAVQGLLVIYGYSALVGNYEFFGIKMSELEVGLPTLMFQGYLLILTDTITPASENPSLGTFLVALFLGLTFAVIAALIVWWAKPAHRKVDISGAVIVFASLLLILFFVPALGALRGQGLAAQDLIQSGLPPSTSKAPPNLTHVITTDQGEKSGVLITATTKYTFLRVDTEVLKIDNDGNKVVRVTKISPRSDGTASKP